MRAGVRCQLQSAHFSLSVLPSSCSFARHCLAAITLLVSSPEFVQQFYLEKAEGGKHALLDLVMEDGPQLYVTLNFMVLCRTVGTPTNNVSLFFT